MDPKIDATDRRSEEPRSGTGKRAECDPDRWDIDGKADGMCAAAREVEGGRRKQKRCAWDSECGNLGGIVRPGGKDSIYC